MPKLGSERNLPVGTKQQIRNKRDENFSAGDLKNSRNFEGKGQQELEF